MCEPAPDASVNAQYATAMCERSHAKHDQHSRRERHGTTACERVQGGDEVRPFFRFFYLFVYFFPSFDHEHPVTVQICTSMPFLPTSEQAQDQRGQTQCNRAQARTS